MRRLFVVCVVWAIALLNPIENARADDAMRHYGMHYVKTTSQLIMRDGMVLPIGAIVPVQYDAGNAWITYSEDEYPKIDKSSAVLLEERLYDLPIDSTANHLISTYQMVLYNTRLMAYAIKPGSAGMVIGDGDAVKIIERLGDYFLVKVPRIRSALISASAITVAAEALRNGRIVPVPPVPAAPTEGTAATATRSPPHASRLYGKLKAPLDVDGQFIPSGGYVSIAYDGGDKWILASLLLNAPTIPKAAVDIVDRVDFFNPLTGKVNRNTQLFIEPPDLHRDPSTLRQSQRLADMNSTAQTGDLVTVTAREGDDYIVQLHKPGFLNIRRVPAYNVDIIYGNPDTGSLAFIAAAPPQSIDAKAPEWAAARARASGQKSNPASFQSPDQKAIIDDSSDFSGFNLFGFDLSKGWIVATFILVIVAYEAIIKTAGGFPWWRASAGAEKQKQEKSATVAEKKRHKELWELAAQRIPEHIFPRHPPYVAEYFNGTDAFKEDKWELWEQILSWGDPPKNDMERQQREDKMWRKLCENYIVVDSNGVECLKPKQEIIDSFFGVQKWFFRAYYAATGIVHETIDGREFVQHIKVLYEHKKDRELENELQKNGVIVKESDAVARARAYFDNYIHHAMPQHKEKWGNWYFFHVEQAFKKKYGKPERKFSKPSDEL